MKREPVLGSRFVLQRKCDGKYYNPGRYPRWVEDIRRSKLYTNSGHCRLAKSSYVPYREFPDEKARKAERARRFDVDYAIIRIGVKFDF